MSKKKVCWKNWSTLLIFLIIWKLSTFNTGCIQYSITIPNSYWKSKFFKMKGKLQVTVLRLLLNTIKLKFEWKQNWAIYFRKLSKRTLGFECVKYFSFVWVQFSRFSELSALKKEKYSIFFHMYEYEICTKDKWTCNGNGKHCFSLKIDLWC